jgi:uncharacterized glyoxalase superfamily protein PhnB/uncharacterized Zn finger protein (UPF0148 family)
MADTQCPISVMFFTRDIKKSIAFYRDVLGFSCKETWPSESDPKWVNLMLGNQSVMFSVHMSAEETRRMCAADPDNLKYMLALSSDLERHKPGVGVVVYLMVEDIDRYHAQIGARGVQAPRPRDQFYGLREMPVDDPDGYRLLFYQSVQVTACQSCGMPLGNGKPGQIYCQYCTDAHGQLRTWDQVFEGTVTSYFMAMHKMERAAAEKAAREHLGRMPAWAHRKKTAAPAAGRRGKSMRKVGIKTRPPARRRPAARKARAATRRVR